ncbi:MAG TPA: DUF1801 domain-containing protein [Acidimicrobiia bacterium]|nr:DUF1801 domain-containing protein [Acidimicrobiia bacterium]
MADNKSDDVAAVLDKIAGMEPLQDIAVRMHEVITAAAPELQPRLWYGMPGYAKSKSSPVICFFRADDGLMTFGLTEKASLSRDQQAPDQLIEAAWFLRDLDKPTEARIADIVKKAAR